MGSQRIRTIMAQLDNRSSQELIEIYAAHDETEWTSEAFDAIRQILEARSVSVPAHVSEREVRAPRGTHVACILNWLSPFLARKDRTRDPWSAGLDRDAVRTVEQGLLLLRAGAIVSNVIWWGFILWLSIPMPRDIRRGWLLVPLLLTGVPYLAVFWTVGDRPTRHGVALGGAIGSILLLVLPFYVITRTIIWLTRGGHPATDWIMLAIIGLLIPAHGGLFLGALFASNGVESGRVGWRGWSVAFLSVAGYVIATVAVLVKLVELAARGHVFSQ
jgi:hypothetical protein